MLSNLISLSDELKSELSEKCNATCNVSSLYQTELSYSVYHICRGMAANQLGIPSVSIHINNLRHGYGLAFTFGKGKT